jgi:hypothetical protein
MTFLRSSPVFGLPEKSSRRVSHHGRPALARPAPLFATWKTRREVHNLRGKKLFRQLRISFGRCHEKRGFRVTHFAVKGRSVELIAEADDAVRLSRGMQGLGVSMAKRINFHSGRTGPAFEDRYSSRTLRSPGEVARALDEVLLERTHHAPCVFDGATISLFRSDLLSLWPEPALVAVPRTPLLRARRSRAWFRRTPG